MGQLNRSLNLTELTFYSVGSIIGAGIYSVIGAAFGEAGSNLWLSFIFAGIAAFLTVLSYAELVSAMPRAGGEYQYLRAAFPKFPMISFMIGYLVALAAAATSATVALAFGGYLKVFIDFPSTLTAFIILVLCTVINIAGIRQSTWTSIGLICIETSGLLLLIWVGFTKGEWSNAFSGLPTLKETPNLFIAAALIFFVYTGFGDIVNLSEESIKPTKNVPRALLLSILVVSVLYVLVAIAVIGLGSPEEISKSESPLSAVTKGVAPLTSKFLGVAALFATASTALIALISISRLLFGMARHNDMPKILSKTLTKRQTPWIAALTMFSAACLLLPLGKVKIIASVSSFSALLVFINVHLAVIILRYKKPDLKRQFFIPFSIKKFPILPLIGIIISIMLLLQFNTKVYLVSVGAILLGTMIYALHRKFSK